MTLTFANETLNSIGIIYSPGATTVPSLVTFKKELENQLVSFISLYKDNHYSKLSNYQAKGTKDIEQTTLCLQTDRPTGAKQYAPVA